MERYSRRYVYQSVRIHAMLLSSLLTPHAYLHVVGMDVKLEQVVCGPAETAFVLSDGRCFVSGLNKFGQLG